MVAIPTNGSALLLTHARIRESYCREFLGFAVGIMHFLTFFCGAIFTQVMGHMVEMFDKVDGEYPLIAYQSTLMLLVGTWLLRLIALAFAKEERVE